MVVARQHRGLDEASNLVWACHRCNLQKVSNLTGIDPVTGEVAPLFNLRRDRWEDHFAFRGAHIDGLSSSSGATVRVLSLNDVAISNAGVNCWR
jgi:hypothetical protein